MDTARSARQNVKIDFFAVDGDQEDVILATSEVMAIFNVKPLPVSLEPLGLHQGTPPNTLLVAHQIHMNLPMATIETLAMFRDTDGSIIQDGEISRLTGLGDTNAEVKRLIKVNVWRIMQRLTGAEPSSWGILRGVRPTKIAHRLLDSQLSRQQVEDIFKNKYLVSAEKAKLTSEIAVYQRKWLIQNTMHSRAVSVYIGIPFCPTRCLYCSFPAYAMPSERKNIEVFLNVLHHDLAAAAELIRERDLTVQTVYIGGGTPTSLTGEDFENLLSVTAKYFLGTDTLEFTVEAGRPDSLDEHKICLMKHYGVTRLSVNPQSMQEKTLKRIGRNHTVKDIINILGKIRNYNFAAINMDVIAGLPGETAEDMRDTMEQILALSPENVTVHTLAIKKGSALKANRAEISLPGDQEVRNMLTIAKSKIAEAGMIPYYLYRQKYMTGQMENVGYAKPGMECIYNIQIMEERQTIVGIGPNSVTKGVGSDYCLESVYFPKDIITYTKDIDRYVRKRADLINSL